MKDASLSVELDPVQFSKGLNKIFRDLKTFEDKVGKLNKKVSGLAKNMNNRFNSAGKGIDGVTRKLSAAAKASDNLNRSLGRNVLGKKGSAMPGAGAGGGLAGQAVATSVATQFALGKSLNNINDTLAKLPGIGKKAATGTAALKMPTFKGAWNTFKEEATKDFKAYRKYLKSLTPGESLMEKMAKPEGILSAIKDVRRGRYNWEGGTKPAIKALGQGIKNSIKNGWKELKFRAEPVWRGAKMGGRMLGQAGLRYGKQGVSYLRQNAGLAFASATKGMKRFGSRISNVLTKLSKLALGIGAIAGGFAVLGKFIKGTIDAAADREAAEAKAQAVIRSTGGASGQTVAGIRLLSKELSKLTGKSITELTNAQAVLSTFTNIKGEQFKSTMMAALDLQAAFGGDLKDNIIRVGKAINDPATGVGALSKVGVTFSEAQKKEIKAYVQLGETQKAQMVILKELARETGNTAAEMKKGIGSIFADFGNQVENFKVAYGTTVAESLPMKAIGNVVDYFTKNLEAMGWAAAGPKGSEAPEWAANIATLFLGAGRKEKAANDRREAELEKQRQVLRARVDRKKQLAEMAKVKAEQKQLPGLVKGLTSQKGYFGVIESLQESRLKKALKSKGLTRVGKEATVAIDVIKRLRDVFKGRTEAENVNWREEAKAEAVKAAEAAGANTKAVTAAVLTSLSNIPHAVEKANAPKALEKSARFFASQALVKGTAAEARIRLGGLNRTRNIEQKKLEKLDEIAQNTGKSASNLVGFQAAAYV